MAWPVKPRHLLSRGRRRPPSLPSDGRATNGCSDPGSKRQGGEGGGPRGRNVLPPESCFL